MIGKYDITSVRARQIFDSRGNPTIECDVSCGKGFGRASVPSGASTGKHEALELRDKGKAYHGKGVLKAIDNIHQLVAPKLIAKDVRDQDGIDKLMINVDGSANKRNLGANATLAVSIACCKAAASAKEAAVYEHIGQIYTHYEPTYHTPVPFFNIINGGKHSNNKLDVQEFMIVPKAKTFGEAMRIGSETYYELKKLLEKKFGVVGVGDEGGFSPPLKKTSEAIDFIMKAAKSAGHSKNVSIALDVAASEFYKSKRYRIDGKQLPPTKLMDYYEKLVESYPIVSIEDPFHEDDFKSFAGLTERIGQEVQIVGDDLFVTSTQRLKEGIRMCAGNAMILKVNQIGTLTEAFEAAGLAFHSSYQVMVSHRSADTTDSFIADLAVGIEAKQIKSGAPCRGERLAKYNQLLRIEEQGVPYAEWF
ncbi:MAG: phosphopyruvate hydratase [Candidatus Diapherotrites archaeon]|nr:phosphopyruvate hydratase [Candidatus Diapherotrites archaeon]